MLGAQREGLVELNSTAEGWDRRKMRIDLEKREISSREARQWVQTSCRERQRMGEGKHETVNGIKLIIQRTT